MRSTTSRPIATCLAALVIGAASAISIPTSPVHAQTTPDEGVPPGSGPSDTATDTEIAEAVAEAAATGQNVEIESLSSPDSEVYAAPDGTFIEEVALEPYQAQAPDGTWAPIDNTLVASGEGTLVPTNNDSGLELSSGGDTVIARITDVHGRSVAYTWHEPLPTPVVEGDTATYPEVLPGVDLKLRATNEGFAKVFEVKTPEAAASEQVATIRLGVELDGFTAAVSETGALEISDFAGNVVYGGPTPVMWDATPADEDVGDSISNEWSPSTFAVTADVATSYADGVLTLTPDPDMLADPDVVYPIRIDPKWVSVGRSAWAMVSDYPAYRNRNYYNGGSFEKDSNGTARLGRAYRHDYTMEQTWRLAFEFNTSKFRGRDIIDANLHLQMTYSWMPNCSGVTPAFEIYELEANLRKWTWNNNGDWGSRIASRTEGVGPSCAAPRDIVTDVTDYVRDVARSDDRVIQFGLKVANESACCTSFRRFGPEKTDSGSGGVHLSVRYNTPPNKPGSFTIDGQPCRSGSTVKLGAAVSWTVTAKLSDDEGDNMDAILRWVDQDSGTTKTWNTSGADRARATWTVRASDLSGQRYRATVAARDGRATGPSAGGCTVLVDTIPPDPPVVTSTDYPDDGLPHGSVGKTGRFTIRSASDDTAGYYWSLQDAPRDNTVPVARLGSGVTIALDPPTDGPLTLSAWAYDEHGNTSAKTTYTFTVGPASSPIAHWKLDETEGTTAADWAYPGNEDDVDVPLTVHGAQWTGGTAADAANNHLNYLTFDGDDTASTAVPVIDTDVSYTVSAWVRIHETDIDYTIASQDGRVNSAFMLKYDGESHTFLFVTCNRDNNQSGLLCPSTPAGSLTAKAGVWYHVTGVYDFGRSQIRLYVNGQLQGTSSVSTVFDANGPFILGRDLYTGNTGTYFAGDIDEVKVWDRVVSTGEIERLGQHAEGIWDFEGIGDTYQDLSGSGHTATGTDVELVEGYTGQAAGFNGSTSTVTTSGPVLNTAGDFTVAAWVRLDRDTGHANVISQDGSYASAFYLGYAPERRWAFRAPSKDASGFAWKELYADVPARLGEWTHLAAVYRAAGGTVDLYVNGRPAAHGEGFSLWAASGRLRIGSVWHRGAVTDYWPGAIDSVNVNTGAFDDQQIAALADISERETHSRLLTGHFNGDPYLDALAVVEEDGRYSDIYLLAGDGEGGFTRTTAPVFESDLLNLIEERDWRLDDAVWRAGDVNGDGRDDLVFAVPGNDVFEVWALPACGPTDRICTQSGALFTQTGIEPLTLSDADGWQLTATQLQVGDVTGDQRDDLVLLRGDGATGYSVWVAEYSTARHNASFLAPSQVASGTGDSRRVELAVADVDADWWGDVIEIRTGSDGRADVYVRYGSASGLQTPVLALDASGDWLTNRDNVTVADVTGDGLPDLVNTYRFTSRVGLQVAVALPDRGGFSLATWGYSARCTGCLSDLTPWTHVRLAGGDVDRDGIDDLLTLRAGEGGDIGALWTRRSTGSGFAAPRPAWADPTTCFGAEGDVNGDGYRDAVLPFPGYDVGSYTDAGAIWFVDGATGQASIVHQNTAGLEGGSEAGDRFGYDVALYDADADGCSEIVVGIPGENDSGGYIQVLPGTRDGIDAAADYMLQQDSPGIPGKREAGDQFGFSVAATNLTDGTPVLVIGVPGEDVQTDTSGAYRDGDTRVPEVTDGGAIIYIQGDVKAWVDQDTPVVTGAVVEAGDQFGYDVAVTPTHLIVGAPFEDTVSNSVRDAGAALVFSHDTTPEGWPAYLTLLDQTDTYVDGNPDAGDRFGHSVAAVDYWPSGRGPEDVETMFAISAPYEDFEAQGFLEAGVVSLVRRTTSGAYGNAGHPRQLDSLGEQAESYDHVGANLELVNLAPTSPATNATLQVVIAAPDENNADNNDGVVHIAGAAAFASDTDTILTHPAPTLNGKLGSGLGFTADRLYLTSPATGGLYSFDWTRVAPGTVQTPDPVAAP